jgi:hypothetical protein
VYLSDQMHSINYLQILNVVHLVGEISWYTDLKKCTNGQL